MYQTFEALYVDGEIKLKEVPPNIKQAKVLVTFLEENEQEQFSNSPKHEILQELRNTFSNIPNERSLTDQLIADRRREASIE